MASINTAVQPDKESVYYQGSLAQMQARQFTNINRDNITFMEIIKNEPRKQSYIDTTEFDARLSKFTFLSNKFIYKKVIDDARVIPEDIVIKNRMDEYFSPRFYKNIQRLYQNAPAYFDYIFSREGIAEQRHKQYSVYIYTLCLIEYTIKHYNTDDFRLIKGYQLYYDWALPKYSEHVSYIIKGPLSKSSTIKIDFKKHYSTIMNPSNVEGDLTPTLQLASLQNLDSKLTLLSKFLEVQDNSYDKLKDEARTYNLLISALSVKYYNEPTLNDTIVIDLRGSDFGNVGNAINKTPTLDSTITFGTDISSRLSIHKLQELFNDYTRLRVPSFSVDMNLYKAPLDWYTQIQLYIKGVQLSSRSVSLHDKGKRIDDDGLVIPGSFTVDPSKKTYNFTPTTDVITYDNKKVRVTDARIYLLHNGTPLNAYYTRTELLPENTYNVIYKYTIPPSVAAQEATLYSFFKYDPLSGIYPVQENLIDISGNLIYKENIDNAVRRVLNGQINTYNINPFTLTMVEDGTPVSYKTHSWDIASEDAFRETIRKAGINLGADDKLDSSIFIVLNAEDALEGYAYKYNADLTGRIWGIEDYYRSIFTVYESVTDSVFKYSSLDTVHGYPGISFTDPIFTIFIYDPISSENRIYTYNYSIYDDIAYFGLKFNNDRWLDVDGYTDDGNRYPYARDEIDIRTTDIITVLTYNDKGYSLENLQAKRIRYTKHLGSESGMTGSWHVGPCLVHLPPLNKVGCLFSNTLTPWFDLRLSTVPMDKRLIIAYTINKGIPMLSLYKYTQPVMMYDGDIINGDEFKLINITDKHKGYKHTDLQISSWNGITILNTLYFVELDIRTNYFAEYEYYDPFNLTLEFS